MNYLLMQLLRKVLEICNLWVRDNEQETFGKEVGVCSVRVRYWLVVRFCWVVVVMIWFEYEGNSGLGMS